MASREAGRSVNDIDDTRVWIPDNVLTAVAAHIGRASNGIVRRIIRKATLIDIEEADRILDARGLDTRSFYLLTQSKRAVLEMRPNLKEDGHTLVEYLVLP